MKEYWETVYERAQQTVGIWQAFAPAFEVGEITLASHTADTNELPVMANAREVQQDALDDAILTRNGSYAFLKDMGVRFPQLLQGVLPPGDPWHAEIDDVRDIPTDSNERRTQRARRVLSLWTRVNAQRAAAVPVLGPLLVGDKTVADLQGALDGLGALLQSVEDENGLLTRKKKELNQQAKKVDKNNKRWFSAWEGNFAPGSPEREALSQIDTGPSTLPPEYYEIAALEDQGGGTVGVTYVPGGGAHATTLLLLWRETATEAEFTHSTALLPDGQTVSGFTAATEYEFKTRAQNSIGSVDSPTLLLTTGG